MIGIHTAEAIRAAEEEFIAANPDTDLMQLAAAAVAERAAQLAPSGTVLVVVGPGNNGGDGLYAARNLARQGRHVTVWLVSGKAHPGGVVAARQASIRFVDSLTVLRMLPEMSLVIDAVAGIGGRPGLSHVVAQFFDACQTLAIPVLAVDVPSGLDPDSHQRPETFVQADHTITFGAPKLCTVAQPAASNSATAATICRAYLSLDIDAVKSCGPGGRRRSARPCRRAPRGSAQQSRPCRPRRRSPAGGPGRARIRSPAGCLPARPAA